MNTLNDMGKLIAEKRRNAGLTQEALAEMLDITPQAVSKWENSVGYPDITLLPKIAKALNISINELFSMEKPSDSFRFPAELNGMKFIFFEGNKACYSSKEVDKVDDSGTVFFTDGSSKEKISKTSTLTVLKRG